jgi:hypothetical protein
MPGSGFPEGDPVGKLPDGVWQAFIWLNLLLLMFMAFLPFPTAVLGGHAGSPRSGGALCDLGELGSW